jgi:cytochrome c biogenesis protein CcdA
MSENKIDALKIALISIKIALVAIVITLVASAIPLILSRYQEEWKTIAETVVIIFYLIASVLILFLALRLKIPKK